MKENEKIYIEDAESRDFIADVVFPTMKKVRKENLGYAGLNDMDLGGLTSENIDDVYDFIVSYFETAYSEDNDTQNLKFITRVLDSMEKFMDFEM